MSSKNNLQTFKQRFCCEEKPCLLVNLAFALFGFYFGRQKASTAGD